MESQGLEVMNPYGQGLDVSDRELDELFPKIDIEFEPFGHRVVVQIRRVVAKSKGGIILAAETRANEAYNSVVGRLIATGPLAFMDRKTAKPWPEGTWAQIGDYVKVSRYGGDRWSVDLEDGLEPIAFAMVADSDLIGKYTGDVRKVRAHLA